MKAKVLRAAIIAASLFLSAAPAFTQADNELAAVPTALNRTVVIRMTDDLKFVPEHPTVSAGDTLVWVNEGAMPHTTTDKPGTAALNEHNVLPAGAAVWDSGLLNSTERFSVVLTVPGEYTYLCYLHEAAGMIGRITVE